MCTSEEKVSPQNNALEVAFVSHVRMETDICRRSQQQCVSQQGKSLI